MAFFKFRKGADEAAGKPRKSAAAQAESVEAMRRRARHRLIGACVLVLAGVVGFPLVFDSQPRPIAVDIPIEIPDRAKARPLTSAPTPAADSARAPQTEASQGVASPAPAAAQAAAAAPLSPAPNTGGAAAAAPARAEASTSPASSSASTATSTPASASTSASSPPAAPSPAPRDDAARARALLEGGVTASGANGATEVAVPGRYVVQVGAFADAALAQGVRLKLERAGLKTYTHVAETKDGKRIRVRLGPFATRSEADQAAEKARRLDVPAAVLTL
jgi:DedD protein